MSYDKSETEYCLTATGWVQTSNLPSDEIVIEKWLEKTNQGSGFGKESVHGEKLWSNPEFDQEQCGALHAKFPFPWSEEVQF